jgi:GPI-anchor transamidase subunit GAA1
MLTFAGWSLWSKDIIFLVTPDTDSGPQAWISAYHSTHDPLSIESLSLKSGALQGAVCVDLPLDHRFEKISISYDGINGQLPNLDLVNTAVSVASGQMGIGTSIQGMHHHDDSYKARLMTMLQGMSNQAVGHGTGAHAVFMSYHIDAITLTATGDGWQDEMALGRTVESIFRSLNNLLEHFHQSFFFYLLMQTNRFVSIGTYLPSAMAIAAGFTIMAIYLWVRSGYVEVDLLPRDPKSKIEANPKAKSLLEDEALSRPPTKLRYEPIDRHIRGPILLILSAHLFGLLPLYLSNHNARSVSLPTPSPSPSSSLTTHELTPPSTSSIPSSSPSSYSPHDRFPPSQQQPTTSRNPSPSFCLASSSPPSPS